MSRAVKITENPELTVLSIITSHDLNPFLVNVPQRHLVTNVDIKFWDYGAFYNTLFIVKGIIEHMATFQLESPLFGSAQMELALSSRFAFDL